MSEKKNSAEKAARELLRRTLIVGLNADEYCSGDLVELANMIHVLREFAERGGIDGDIARMALSSIDN